MGLDFYKYKVHWSYSGFGEFRRRLAREVGIDLDQMNGFYRDWAMKPEEFKDIPWDNVTDPIKYLLDHSDCEGELTPEQCAVVAPRLVHLIRNWGGTHYIDYDFQQAMRLAAAMRVCARAGEALQFE